MGVRVSHESARGCGFRKPGGLYLVSDGPGEECGFLPAEMCVCPTCNQGIKPARGYTWVDGGALFPPTPHGDDVHNARCPFGQANADDPSRLGRCGLIWIGEQFYATPQDFAREADRMGISRRITAVPRDFKAGETWVLLGHRKAVVKGVIDRDTEATYETLQEALDAGADSDHVETYYVPGIFYVFRPSRVEYVVKPEDEQDEEFLDSLRKRGVEPVKVVPVKDELALEVE